MKWLAAAACLTLAACAAPVTQQASMVRQVPVGGSAGCKFLGVVQVEGGLIYSSTAEGRRDMLNRIRNTVAERGGNAFAARDVIVEKGFSLPSAEAEAYTCS